VPWPNDPRCPRCDSALHERKPNTIARTRALIFAAAILYIPANYCPVLSVVQLGARQPSTILGRVEELMGAFRPAHPEPRRAAPLVAQGFGERS